jgi:hypothetical protein
MVRERGDLQHGMQFRCQEAGLYLPAMVEFPYFAPPSWASRLKQERKIFPLDEHSLFVHKRDHGPTGKEWLQTQLPQIILSIHALPISICSFRISVVQWSLTIMAALQPTYKGYIATTEDALILFEACLRGLLPSVLRRPKDHERDSLAQSGNVFIYGEEATGIKRWTDGAK